MANSVASQGTATSWHPWLVVVLLIVWAAELTWASWAPRLWAWNARRLQRVASGRSTASNAAKERGPADDPVPAWSPTRRRRNHVLFALALASTYAALGYPVADLSARLFGAHMLQALLLSLAVPPLLLTSVPPALLRSALRPRAVRALVAALTHPLPSFLVFNLVLSVLQLPGLLDATLRDPWLQTLAHTVLFITAVFMWWPVIGPLPGFAQLRGLRMVGYLFIDALVTTPLFIYLVFAQAPLYAPYVQAATLSTGAPLEPAWLAGVVTHLTPMEDQEFGGALMRAATIVVYMWVALAAFLAWLREGRELEQIPGVVLFPEPEDRHLRRRQREERAREPGKPGGHPRKP